MVLIVLEMFKTQDKTPDAGKILVRAPASILMLVSIKETINLIAFISEMIMKQIRKEIKEDPESKTDFSNVIRLRNTKTG